MIFPFKKWAPLAVCVLVYPLLPGCKHAAPNDPVSQANAFFRQLEHGDPRAAYDSSAFGFQAAQSFEGFLSNARSLGIVGGQPPNWTSNVTKGKEADLSGAIIGRDGKPVNVSVVMTPDGGTWRLFSLQTTSDANYGQADNPFTLVGKGSGFNDVYHQPMPGPQQLADLIHETMARFNTALQTADFHDFYSHISEQWKNGERLSGADTQGVTENMLKEHFQPFIDKKINLAAAAGAQPVYDQPPQINADGLLSARGHFDTPDFRVNFELEYAYELPRWKLFGIDISLTK